MREVYLRQLIAGVVLFAVSIAVSSCGATGKNEVFFGKVVPPSTNVLRYVNGDEPESLDPPMSSGQPEARIYMALYEGLVEYHPLNLFFICDIMLGGPMASRLPQMISSTVSGAAFHLNWLQEMPTLPIT